MEIIQHQPPNAANLTLHDRAIFLAGPIQGAPNWQAQAVNRLQDYDSAIGAHVFNPRRPFLAENFNYEQQVMWEKAYLRRAARFGAIIFWFARQDPKLPYEKGRAYAQTSRIEFGRVMGWLDTQPDIKLSIGVEPGYSGSEKYFKSCAAEFGLPIHTELGKTCDDAAELIQPNS